MKLFVIVDERNRLIGTAGKQRPPEPGEFVGGASFVIIGSGQQRVVEVDVPDELLSGLNARELLTRGWVDFSGDVPKLVMRDTGAKRSRERLVRHGIRDVPGLEDILGDDEDDDEGTDQGHVYEIGNPTPHTIVIKFAGVFQDRLATDPDKSDEKRGVDGWTFAHTGEPDLDRIIRFNNPQVPRSCSDLVKVDVADVLIDGTSVADALKGKLVDLGPKSFFDGSKDSPGLEPIKEFEFHIRGAGGDYISGEATTPPKGTGAVMGPIPEILRMMGLDPSKIDLTKEADQDKVTGWASDWYDKKWNCLLNHLNPGDGSPAPQGDAAKALKERIRKHAGRTVQFMFASAKFPGKVDKNVKYAPQDSDIVKKLKDGGVTTFEFDSIFFSFDGDGLIGHVEGSISATVSY